MSVIVSWWATGRIYAHIVTNLGEDGGVTHRGSLIVYAEPMQVPVHYRPLVRLWGTQWHDLVIYWHTDCSASSGLETRESEEVWGRAVILLTQRGL